MNGARPRVLQIVDSLGMGGAETWLVELLRFWSKNQAVQVDFLATGGKNGIFDDEVRQLGARVHYLHYSRADLAQFARQFRSLLREGRYDAIHDHQDYISGWHFLMGTGHLPPVRITHVHNASYQIFTNYGLSARRRFIARVGRALIARYSTHIAGTSRQVINDYGFDTSFFSRIPKGYLYCGFDPNRFIGERSAAKASICAEFEWPGNAIIILSVGRIDWTLEPSHPWIQKNSGFAVSVAIEATRRDSRIRMLMVGAPSPATPILQRRIANAGLSDRICLAGIRTDIERFMLGADVLFFPSRGEGLGMVAVEAQAAGLPVLASDSVPRECVVVPGLVNFQNINAGETVWASQLLNLASQPRNHLKANQSVARSPFSIEASAHALAKLYQEGTLPC